MQADLNTLSVTELAALYRSPLERWVRSNMVLSLDGNFAGTSGSSRELSSVGDLRVLLLLRALSDVVVVGARTALGEKYDNLRVRDDFLPVTDSAPRLCVISASLSLMGAGFLGSNHHRPIVMTSRSEDMQWQRNLESVRQSADIIISESNLTGAFIVESLHALGLDQILCEGGPALNAVMAHDGVFDELAVTLAPIVVGRVPTQPPLGEAYSTWHRSLVGVADEHTFFRFTGSALHSQL